MRLFIIGAALICAFALGGEISAIRASSLLPLRTTGGECTAVNQDSGKLVGEWAMRQGRCELQDWRIWHPFGELSG
jgi:hypothetical protein